MNLGLGIDPSTTKTGLALLEYRRVKRGPISLTLNVRPVWAHTVAPRGKAWEDRLAPMFHELCDALVEALEQARIQRATPLRVKRLDVIVIENPELLGRNAKSNSAVMAAFGVAVAAVERRLHGWAPVVHLRAQKWIPKVMVARGGGGRRQQNMGHDQALKLLHQVHPTLGALKDDEMFAAGVLLAHLSGGPIRV